MEKTNYFFFLLFLLTKELMETEFWAALQIFDYFNTDTAVILIMAVYQLWTL